MPERNPHIYATGARTPCTIKTSQVAGRKINFVLAKRNDVRIGPPEHAQIDRLRRRYVRQAQTAGARPDGDFPGIGGRGVCRSAQKARHSHRPERRLAQERASCPRTEQTRTEQKWQEAEGAAQIKNMIVVISSAGF